MAPQSTMRGDRKISRRKNRRESNARRHFALASGCLRLVGGCSISVVRKQKRLLADRKFESRMSAAPAMRFLAHIAPIREAQIQSSNRERRYLMATANPTEGLRGTGTILK